MMTSVYNNSYLSSDQVICVFVSYS